MNHLVQLAERPGFVSSCTRQDDAAGRSAQIGPAATISLGDAELKLTPRLADGSPTWLGTITVPCTVKAGQNTQFHSFPVTTA